MGTPLRLVSGRIAGRGGARGVREWSLCRLRSVQSSPGSYYPCHLSSLTLPASLPPRPARVHGSQLRSSVAGRSPRRPAFCS